MPAVNWCHFKTSGFIIHCLKSCVFCLGVFRGNLWKSEIANSVADSFDPWVGAWDWPQAFSSISVCTSRSCGCLLTWDSWDNYETGSRSTGAELQHSPVSGSCQFLKPSNSDQETNQRCWSHVLREHFTFVSKGIQEGQYLEQNPAVTCLEYRFSERTYETCRAWHWDQTPFSLI